MLCDYNDQMCVHTCFRNSIGVTRIQDCIGIALTIISLVFEASINTINISFVFFLYYVPTHIATTLEIASPQLHKLAFGHLTHSGRIYVSMWKPHCR